MKKYVLDTNLYVKAFRNREAAAALERFYASFTPQSYLSSVVLHELLAGANTRAKARQIDLRNSGDIASDRDRVVGYGAFVFEPALP